LIVQISVSTVDTTGGFRVESLGGHHRDAGSVKIEGVEVVRCGKGVTLPTKDRIWGEGYVPPHKMFYFSFEITCFGAS